MIVAATCNETIAAGQLVQLYNAGGSLKARLALATSGYEANAFCVHGGATNDVGGFSLRGVASRLGMTPGAQYLSQQTPGACTSVRPNSGTVQLVGVALSATELASSPASDFDERDKQNELLRCTAFEPLAADHGDEIGFHGH